MKNWLAECDPSPHLLSVGRHIDIYKDEGHPSDIARRYHFAQLAGSHCVGHTRMATESAVTPEHAHPFTAGEDFCLVHNGSLSNPYMLRRKLEAQGLHFETDNDTEAACRFIEWRMQQGETLDQALHTAFQELDGFYTLLIATGDQMTLVRDAFACKPAVVPRRSRRSRSPTLRPSQSRRRARGSPGRRTCRRRRRLHTASTRRRSGHSRAETAWWSTRAS